jgi:hypothetical protein
MKISACLLSMFLMIQIFTLDLKAQEESKEKTAFNHNVTIHLGRFLMNEARFGYERSLDELRAFRIVLGLQYPTSGESFNSNQFPFYDVIPSYYKVSKGIYIGAGYNKTSAKYNLYTSAEIYFNYNAYDKKYYHFITGMNQDCYDSYESMKLFKTGLKVIFGRKTRLVSGNKMGLELDFFAGIGAQYRQKELTTFEYKAFYNSPYKYDPPKFEIIRSFYPTLHIGVLLGVPFGVK